MSPNYAAIYINKRGNEMARSLKVWKSYSQKEWEIEIKVLLKTNDVALKRAIVLIYELQTDEEKNLGIAKEENNVGFSKIDAEFLSKIAKKIKNNLPLDDAEIIISRNKMQKYWKQLMHISLKNIEEKESLEKQKLIAIKNEKERVFRENQEEIRKCLEEGIPCEYGICSECLLNEGIQMKINI